MYAVLLIDWGDAAAGVGGVLGCAGAGVAIVWGCAGAVGVGGVWGDAGAASVAIGGFGAVVGAVAVEVGVGIGGFGVAVVGAVGIEVGVGIGGFGVAVELGAVGAVGNVVAVEVAVGAVGIIVVAVEVAVEVVAVVAVDVAVGNYVWVSFVVVVVWFWVSFVFAAACSHRDFFNVTYFSGLWDWHCMYCMFHECCAMIVMPCEKLFGIKRFSRHTCRTCLRRSPMHRTMSGERGIERIKIVRDRAGRIRGKSGSCIVDKCDIDRGIGVLYLQRDSISRHVCIELVLRNPCTRKCMCPISGVVTVDTCERF